MVSLFAIIFRILLLHVAPKLVAAELAAPYGLVFLAQISPVKIKLAARATKYLSTYPAVVFPAKQLTELVVALEAVGYLLVRDPLISGAHRGSDGF